MWCYVWEPSVWVPQFQTLPKAHVFPLLLMIQVGCGPHPKVILMGPAKLCSQQRQLHELCCLPLPSSISPTSFLPSFPYSPPYPYILVTSPFPSPAPLLILFFPPLLQLTHLPFSTVLSTPFCPSPLPIPLLTRFLPSSSALARATSSAPPTGASRETPVTSPLLAPSFPLSPEGTRR